MWVGRSMGGTCLCQWNGVAVQRYAGRPDVSVPAERSGCSTVCGETGRVRVSGTGWQLGPVPARRVVRIPKKLSPSSIPKNLTETAARKYGIPHP